MMNIFKKKPTQLSDDLVNKVADVVGIEVTKDKDGNWTGFPKGYLDELADAGVSKDKLKDFIEFFTDAALGYNREQKYKLYKAMDATMSEASLTLDTYADEMFSIGFMDEPIEISISDSTIEKKVIDILKRSKILEHSRADGRDLCKYGDIGYEIIVNKRDDESDPTHEDIIVNSRLPETWEVVTLKGTNDVILGYKYLEPKRQRIKGYRSQTIGVSPIDRDRKNLIQPWQFVQSTVLNNETKPYGRSLLENMRVPLDQLNTLEALLALSRASRVERLVVKVPVDNSNPSAAMSQLNSFKTKWKNVIFKDSKGDTKTKGRTPALSEVLFMPAIEGFEIDKINSSIDISSTDDVEHFRDKTLLASRLPKGYFTTDSTVDRGGALAAMDLKFARTLLPYQYSYANGLTKLCMLLTAYCGGDLNNVKVSVRLKRPPQVAGELIETYSNIFRTASDMIDGFKRAVAKNREEPEIAVETFKNILVKLGIPKDIADEFVVRDKNKEAPTEVNLDSFYVECNSEDIVANDPFFKEVTSINDSDNKSYLKESVESVQW